MTKRKPPPKPRNPVAKALADPLFRKRVVKAKRKYSRKKDEPPIEEDQPTEEDAD
jgi:stalled ribosome alternative rescue factor ArfA